VLDAAAFGSAGPITFTSALSGQTILLTNGPIVLSNNVTINASALANGIQINGNGQSRIFQVNGNTTVVLNSLILANGAAAGANGGTFENGGDGTGGGIYNAGTLTVNNCTLANNSAVGGTGGTLATGGNGSGGGIYNAGTLTVNNSTLANNSGTGGRGADGAGPGSGGGIYNAGTLTVNNSTLANNSGNGGGDAGGNGLGYGGSGYGGGIYNVGTLTVNNSTFANNSVTGQNGGVFDGGGSGAGGGIYNAGTLTVNNSTMANNSSVGGTGGFGGTNGTVEGGGIRNALTLNLTNSIVCSNTASFNPNISGNYPNANNLVDADALLAPLGNYGGPTQTMPPEPGSPAINAGRPTLLTTDQRGSPRPVGAPDIGSVEIQPGETHTIVLNANDAGPGSLRQTILSAPGSPTITFAPDLSGQTILLTGGQIVLSNTFITIDGSELALGIQINGNGNSRIFQVNSGTFALLAALTLTNGNPGNAAAGGGIFNLGTVEVAACTLAGNSSSQGGAIENESTCILLSCTLTGNHSVNNGGAIDNNAGPLELIQCTLYGNSAGGSGGGVANFLNTLALTNCIVAENTGAGSDLFNFGSSTIAAGGTNIVQSYFNGGTFTGTGSLLAKAPLLSPLGNYGGPTLTLPPLSGSPAIDAGDTAVDTAIHITGDQRGYPRISGARVDIGAVEAQYAPANNPPVLKNPVWSSAGSGGGTFQFTFTNSAHIDFTALTSTNLALTLADWSVLGNIPEISPGVYQFADIGETNSPQRFYRVTSP